MRASRFWLVGFTLLVSPVAALGQTVWSSGPTNIWAVPGLTPPFHWDGRAWSLVVPRDTEAAMRAIWTSGPTDAFTVGDGGAIFHSDGRTWTQMQSGTDRDLVGIAGRSATEVYAVTQSREETERPLLLRYDGRTWSRIPLPFPFLIGGLAVTPTEVIVAGFVMRDPRPDQKKVFGVLARLAGGVWRFTGFDGQRVNDPLIGRIGWTGVSAVGSAILLSGSRPDTTRNVERMEEYSSDENKVLALTTGAGWRLIAPPAGNNAKFAFVGADGVPVALDQEGAGFARYTGGRWTTVRAPARGEGESPAPAGVTGASANDFYVLRYDGIVMHVVGSTMTPMNKQWIAQQLEAEQQQTMQQAQAQREAQGEQEEQVRAAAAAQLQRHPPTERDLGVPIYPGAKFDAQTSAGMSQEEEKFYVYVTTDPAAKVTTFYEGKTGKKATRVEDGSFAFSLTGDPWPDLTVQSNLLGPFAGKTVITVRKHVKTE